MRIFFAVAALCCGALVWAAVYLARYVGREHRLKAATERKMSFAEALLKPQYGDPDVGGRKLKLHPREDMAAGRVAGTSQAQRTAAPSQRRPVVSVTDESIRPDRRYGAQTPGDLSDPDTHRVSGVLPQNLRRAGNDSNF